MSSVSNFISELNKYGVARSEKFKVEIVPPPAIQNQLTVIRNIPFFCESVDVPGLNIITRPAKIHNLNIQRPSTIDYMGDGINLTFLVDGSWNIKKFFDAWTDIIVDRNREIGEYKNIVGTVTIHNLHESNTSATGSEHKETVNYKVKLIDAFPKNISPLPAGYGNVGVHRLNVLFTYKYWQIETT
jgi:hypothetical protein